MHDAMHLFNNVCSSNCTLIHDVHNQYTIHNTSNDPIIMLPDAKMCMPMQNIGVGNGQPMHKMQNSFYHRLCMICNWRWLIADILHTIISIYLHLLVCNIPGADSGSIYYPQRNGADSPAVLSPETTQHHYILHIYSLRRTSGLQNSTDIYFTSSVVVVLLGMHSVYFRYIGSL